jgi:ABC-type transporter Mla maintaining outer membrane lipid asymmetry ATPase subunit MlaF
MNDDLIYTRADMEAAIKRALEAAASVEIVDDPDRKMDPMIADVIRDLIPAQFIEEPKE